MTPTLLLLTILSANPAPPQGPPVRVPSQGPEVRETRRSAYSDVLELVESGREVTVYVGVDPPKGRGLRARLETFDGHRSGVFRCFVKDGEAKYERIDSNSGPVLLPEKTAGAYRDPIGWHRHKCESCAFVWSHPDGTDSAGHYCPGCGRYENDKYRGVDPPSTPAPSPQVRPKRVSVGGRWYDEYPDGRRVECAT